MTTDAYETYRLFTALRIHFNEETYNFNDYNGNIKAIKKKEDFLLQNDRFHYAKLAKKWGNEIKDFLIANLYQTPNIWITDLCKLKESEANYLIMKKWESNPLYHFESEMKAISMGYEPKKLLGYDGSSVPDILVALYNNQISPQSFFYLDSILHFTDKWNGLETKFIPWEKRKLALKKLSMFYSFKDIDLYREIVNRTLKKSLDKPIGA